MRVFVEFFPCVNSNMCLQIILSAKWMATMEAFKWFFPFKKSNMLLQTRMPSKGFGTFSAAVGPLLCKFAYDSEGRMLL